MPNHHDYGIDCEAFCGGTPDDEPTPGPLTCVHAGSGLCPDCQADFNEDPAAYVEFGQHPAGIERWNRLVRIMAEDANDAPSPGAWDDIPF